MGGALEWAAKVTAAKWELANLMDVPAHSIHFVGSTTEALNLVAQSLPLQRGDKVVVAEDEFPSVVQSWLSWQRQGVELIHVPIAHESERTEMTLCTRSVPVCGRLPSPTFIGVRAHELIWIS